MSTPMKFTQNDFAKGPKFSKAMKEIMSDKDVAHVLNSESKRETVYNVLKEHSGSASALPEALKKLGADKRDNINSYAVSVMKKKLMDSGRSAVPQKDIQRRSLIASAPASFGSRQPVSRPVTGAQLSQKFARGSASLMNSGLIKK